MRPLMTLVIGALGIRIVRRLVSMSNIKSARIRRTRNQNVAEKLTPTSKLLKN